MVHPQNEKRTIKYEKKHWPFQCTNTRKDFQLIQYVSSVLCGTVINKQTKIKIILNMI